MEVFLPFLRSYQKKIWILIFIWAGFFVFTQTPENTNEKITIVTIEQAERTQSKKDPVSGNSIIVFSGGVKLSVEKDTTKIHIAAQSVQFDRERQTLYAEGKIIFEQKKGNEEGETLTATSLLLNIDTLEGIFDASRIVQQKSNALNLSEGSVMVIFSNISGKEESGTVAFKNAELTFCDVEDPHWKIKASRVWLLPGNEFAFFNALIYVGPVPVGYLPFFYYPKDELIFNPVFGSRTREGWFVQTTTYLLGRKNLQKTDDDKSLYNFIQPTQLMEQKRDGILLRNLNEPAKNIPKHAIKLIADYYSGLGALAGIDSIFKFDNGVVKDLSFNFFLGFSRNLYPNPYLDPQLYPAQYIPYNPDTGHMEWNSSNLFGMELPFRYSANYKMSLSHTFFSLNMTVPIHSDPYFNDDFMKRSEFMDWLSYATKIGSSSSQTEDSTTSSQIVSELSWILNGTLTPTLPALSPYITTLQITGIESSILFRSKDNQSLDASQKNIDPLRKFYFPHQITPIKFTLKLSGSIFTTKKEEQSATAKKEDPLFSQLNLELPTELEKPVATNQDEQMPTQEVAVTEQNSTEAATKKTEPIDAADKLYETLAIASPQLQNLAAVSYSLNYNINTSFSSTFLNETTNWKTVSDIKWGEFESTYYRVYGTTDLISDLSFKDGFFSLSNQITLDANYQIHPELSDTRYTTKTSKDQVIESDHSAFKVDLINTNVLAIKPLIYSSYFKDSAISWKTGLKVVRTKFVGTADLPEWDYQLPEWDASSFSDHYLSADIASRQNLFYQILTIQTNLAPVLEKYTGKLRLGFPYSEISIDTGIEKKSLTEDSWRKVPITQTASFSQQLWKSTLKFNQSFKYELDDERYDAFSISAEYAGLSFAYSMLYTYDYTYDEGWVASPDRVFIPYTFTVRYNSGNFDLKWGTDEVRFQTSLNTALTMDLVRPTNSSFTFAPSISIKIKNALELTFTAETENKIIYRYIQNATKGDLKIPGETNVFKDLWNSFAFWDESLRRASGFKIKSFNFKATHDLHDWSFAAEVKMTPRLLYTSDRKPYYDFTPYWSLSVVWKPFSSMKTTLVDDYGKVKLNPQE